jgi:curved DNA-binding protein CbpA
MTGHSDPEAVLGIHPGATDEEIRAAYLSKVKQYPPDRSPEEFERVRDAYEVLRDRRQRARRIIIAPGADQPLAALLDGHPAQRRFTGFDPWLKALEEAPPAKRSE